MSATFANLTPSEQAQFARALGSKWRTVCSHCNIYPSEVMASCTGLTGLAQSQRFCEILHERSIPLTTVAHALDTAPRRDVLDEFQAIFDRPKPAPVATMTTFAHVPLNLRDEFALGIGHKWRETAAQLNLPGCIITGTLPPGYCPADCARALVQWMVDHEILIEDVLRALKDAGISRVATEYGPRFRDVGALVSFLLTPWPQ